MVEAHGGRIWADSEPGRGSAFTFELPVASPHGGARQGALEQSARHEGDKEERMTSATTTIEVAAPERYAYLDLTEELERAIKDSGVTDGRWSRSAPTRRAR